MVIETIITLPLRRDVAFSVGKNECLGFVAIVGIEVFYDRVVCYLVAELDARWEGTASGADVLQALSISTRLLDLKMELANAWCI